MLTTLLVAAFAIQQPLTDVVVGTKFAYVMLEPKVIFAANVLDFSWNLSGTSLLIRTQDPVTAKFVDFANNPTPATQPKPPTVDVRIYDFVAERASMVVKDAEPPSHRLAPRWVGNALLVTKEGGAEDGAAITIGLWQKGDSTPKIVQTWEHAGGLQIESSRFGALLSASKFTKSGGMTFTNSSAEFCVIDPKGKIRSFSIPEVNQGELHWGTDGIPYVQLIRRRPIEEIRAGRKPTFLKEWVALRDRVTPVGTPAAAVGEDLEASELYLDFSLADAKDKGQQTLDISLRSRVQSEFNRALVGRGIAGAKLSPDLKRIAFISQRTLFVRDLKQMDRALFESLIASARRTEAMSNAKQSALAALLYGADMDDVLPGKDANVQELLGPYLKNNSVMKDFVYVFAGGNLNTVANPAETVLGYIPGPGGKAVAYVDGHVKWIPDKP
jgi:hypothetical protein